MLVLVLVSVIDIENQIRGRERERERGKIILVPPDYRLQTDFSRQGVAEMTTQHRACSVPYAIVGLFLITVLTGPWTSWGQEAFRQPQNFTQDDVTSGSHMSRSTGGQLAWTRQDRLALIYWDGKEDVSVNNPNRILYREWTPNGGWSAPEQVNHPLAENEPNKVWRRQPAMIVRPNGDIFAVWHDHRHCDGAGPSGGSMVNNIEIYGAMGSAGGHFNGPDIRLTQTGSTSVGDNGYLPKLAALPDGRFVMTWFDFYWDNFVSEIAMKISDANGSFGDPAAMNETRMTQPGDRAAGDEGEKGTFTVPSVAVDGDGIIHLVWATSIYGPSKPETALYYGRYNPATSAWLEKTRLRTQAGGQTDPAKLVTDSSTGDVWLVCTDFGLFGNSEIVLQHRAKGATAFDAPIRMTEDGAEQKNPDMAIDSSGIIHLVYVDLGGENRAVRYLTYDPATQTTARQEELTQGTDKKWARPAILCDPTGNLYAVWEQAEDFDQDWNLIPSALWFTTTLRQNSARDWTRYE